MRVLVVDIGGTNVKLLASGRTEPRKTPSGPGLTPRKMVAAVKELAPDWEYDAVATGYPGRVVDGRIKTEPKKWQKHVEFAAARLIEAFHPDDVVLGGGNAKKLKTLPKGCRLGNNLYAFIGGYRLFEKPSGPRLAVAQPTPRRKAAREALKVASL